MIGTAHRVVGTGMCPGTTKQTKCALPEIRLGRPISGPEAPLINIGLSRCMPRQSLFMSEETRSGNRSASVHVRSASVHVRTDALRKPERVCSCPNRRAPKSGARLFMSEETRSGSRSASVHVRSASVHVRTRVCSCPKRRAPETGACLFMSINIFISVTPILPES